ncbi:MAG: TonB-dependent receptor [gamma proteobacterium endosymbiont of Lamellibrachia anaximandri]|nr:TonB-dependent receptor [gamma proteobacterium endosymbiont of Lamellibrachia anaximandri]
MQLQRYPLRYIRLLSSLVILPAICLQIGNAAEPDPISEDYFFEELPVVLSATRLSQSLADTPTAMTIIDKEMIRASGSRNIPDLLRLVPGFAVGFYSGSRATATYHGMADQYARDMQVLIDGRSVYDPAFGGVAWADMPIEVDEIARIEVIRGPNAAAYGSNSFAGVVNIITDHPADRPGAMLKTIIGEGNARKIYGRYADSIGDFAYRISANYEEYDGFEEREDSADTRWFNFHGEQTLDNDDTVEFRVGFSRGNYGEGWSDIFQQTRVLNNRYNFQQIAWTHQQSPSNEFRLQFYHNYQQIEDNYRSPIISDIIKGLDDLQGFPEPIRPDIFALGLSGGNYNFQMFLDELKLTDSPLALSWLGFESDRYDLEFQQTLQTSDNLRLVWGAGARQDRGKSVWIFHQHDAIMRNQIRLFANTEWHISPAWVVNAGGMVEHFEDKDPLFSPRLAINHHIDQHNTIRANASRAYRMPTLLEDHINLVVFLDEPLNDVNTWVLGTGSLDPQSIDSFELGYLGSFPEVGLTLDLKLFHERIDNIINEFRNLDIPDPDRGLTDPIALATLNNFNELIQEGADTYINAGKATINGLEVNLDFRPTPRDLIFLGYGYANTYGQEAFLIQDGTIQTRNSISDNAASHTFSILGSHRFDSGIQISSAYYYVGEMVWSGEGDLVPTFRRWDVRLGKQFTLPGMDGEIALIGQNLNGGHVDFFNAPNRDLVNRWETRFFLQASLGFR